jgi:LacI family transcriptional regulator
MTVTLRDVAEKANVSVSTVSRVLNNKTTNIPISQSTRQRVLQAVQEIGYRPNIAARHLVNKKSFNLIGIILPTAVPDLSSHPFYMTLVRGVTHLCQQEGYAVTIHFINTDQADEVDQSYPHILEIPTSGYILATTLINDQLLPRFTADHVPFVHVGRLASDEGEQSCFVDVDNYRGGSLAVEHLLGKGHQKIATIAATEPLHAGAERLRGYQETMCRAGISPHPDWIVYSEFQEAGGYAAMEKLLNSEDRPTAVFAASDSIALGAIKAIQDHGLEVPTDMAVVGFDDIPDALRSQPPLTTIRQPIFDLGETAAKLLLAILKGENDVASVILQPKLIVRDTT